MAKHSGEGRVLPVSQPDKAVTVGYMYEDWANASHAPGSRIASGRIYASAAVLDALSQCQDLILQTEEGDELRIEVTRGGELYIIA